MLSLMPPEALVESWEDGLKRVATLYNVARFCAIHVCVGRGSAQSYHVFRYFPLGGKWEVSVDASDVVAAEAFKALEKSFN